MYCLSHLLNTYSVRVLELNAVSRSTIFFKHLRGTSEHLCVCVLPADAIFLKAGKGESTETVMVICCSLVVELNTLVTTCFSVKGNIYQDAITQCRINFTEDKVLLMLSGVQECCVNQTNSSLTPSQMFTTVLK